MSTFLVRVFDENSSSVPISSMSSETRDLLPFEDFHLLNLQLVITVRWRVQFRTGPNHRPYVKTFHVEAISIRIQGITRHAGVPFPPLVRGYVRRNTLP
jgi:hypothetical protein